jgi:hypothetical protein
MDGSNRGRQPALELKREFAGSRLEEQVLIRAFELAIPVARVLTKDEQAIPGLDSGRHHDVFSKGA